MSQTTTLARPHAATRIQARGGRPRRRRPSPVHLLLVPLTVVMLAPLIWMVLLSISTEAETRRFPPGLPSGVHWHNYVDAWHQGPFGTWLVNSRSSR